MEARYKGKVRGLSIQSFHFVRAEQVWRVVRALVNSAWIVGLLVLAYFYLHYALSLFPWTRGLAQDLLQLVSDPLQKIGWGIIQKIPDLVFIAILIAVTRYVLFLIELFFTAIENETIKLHEFDPMWAKPTYLVVAYPYIPGSGSEAFKGVSLFVGVLVSLGSSSLIGHIIAGYTMTYRRTFKKGDRVRIGQHLGDVEHSRLTATYLRTPKNEIVIVPNSKIINEEVVNYSTLARERGLILHTTVDVGYDAPWRQVEAMLLEAAGRTPGVFREPKPYVLQKALGQFAVTYEINAYCDQPNIMGRLYAQLHRNILDLFNEYGVQIMTPSYEGDPEIAKVVPLDRFHVAPASESDRPIDVAEDSEDPGAPSFRKAS
jgi:hypothetical protein